MSCFSFLRLVLIINSLWLRVSCPLISEVICRVISVGRGLRQGSIKTTVTFHPAYAMPFSISWFRVVLVWRLGCLAFLKLDFFLFAYLDHGALVDWVWLSKCRSSRSAGGRFWTAFPLFFLRPSGVSTLWALLMHQVVRWSADTSFHSQGDESPRYSFVSCRRYFSEALSVKKSKNMVKMMLSSSIRVGDVDSDDVWSTQSTVGHQRFVIRGCCFFVVIVCLCYCKISAFDHMSQMPNV